MKQPFKEAVARRDSKVQPKNTSNMVRSKSTSSLQTSGKSASKQQTSPVTIKSLRSLFEPQEGSQKDPKDTARSLVRSSSYKETSTKKVMDGDVEKMKRPAEKPKATGPAARPVSKLKDDRLSEKVLFVLYERRFICVKKMNCFKIIIHICVSRWWLRKGQKGGKQLAELILSLLQLPKLVSTTLPPLQTNKTSKQKVEHELRIPV